MESLLSDYLRIFLNLIIPGFIYLLCIFILLKTYNIVDIWDKVKKNKEFYPYLGILIIILSFLIGLVAYLTEQEIKVIKNNIVAIITGSEGEECNFIHKVDQQLFNNVYGVLIMLRHLIYSISILVLFIVISVSSPIKKDFNKKFILIFYLFIYTVLLLSYFKIRMVINSWNNEENETLSIIIVFAIFFLISFLPLLTLKQEKK